MSFFYFLFFINTPYSHADILSKNVNSVKTKLQYLMGHKSPKDTLFSDSSRKNRCSHTHILSQVRLFSKEHTALKFMYYEKTSDLSKTLCSHVIFFKFFMKNPCCQAHISSKNRPISQNYTILGQKRQ